VPTIPPVATALATIGVTSPTMPVPLPTGTITATRP
jgi:hypothetical protein